MKTVVAVVRPATGEGRKPLLAGTNVKWPVMKPVYDAASQDVRFDFMTSIWCGAMVGCIGAAVIAPFPESRS